MPGTRGASIARRGRGRGRPPSTGGGAPGGAGRGGLLRRHQAELALPETRDAREDFRRQITALADLLRGPRGRAMAAMLGGALSDGDLAQALNARWLEPRRRWGFARLSRAVAEGQCRPGIDVPAALGVLYGPLYTPLLFGQDVPTPAQVSAHLAIAFSGVFVAQ